MDERRGRGRDEGREVRGSEGKGGEREAHLTQVRHRSSTSVLQVLLPSPPLPFPSLYLLPQPLPSLSVQHYPHIPLTPSMDTDTLSLTHTLSLSLSLPLSLSLSLSLSRFLYLPIYFIPLSPHTLGHKGKRDGEVEGGGRREGSRISRERKIIKVKGERERKKINKKELRR